MNKNNHSIKNTCFLNDLIHKSNFLCTNCQLKLLYSCYNFEINITLDDCMSGELVDFSNIDLLLQEKENKKKL